MGLASLVGPLYVGRYAGKSGASGLCNNFRDKIWSRIGCKILDVHVLLTSR